MKIIDTANVVIHHGTNVQVPAAAGPNLGPGPSGEGGSGAGSGPESGSGNNSGTIKLPSNNLLTASTKRKDAEHPTFSSKRMKSQKDSTANEIRRPIQLVERENKTVYTPESVEEKSVNK